MDDDDWKKITNRFVILRGISCTVCMFVEIRSFVSEIDSTRTYLYFDIMLKWSIEGRENLMIAMEFAANWRCQMVFHWSSSNIDCYFKFRYDSLTNIFSIFIRTFNIKYILWREFEFSQLFELLPVTYFLHQLPTLPPMLMLR